MHPFLKVAYDHGCSVAYEEFNKSAGYLPAMALGGGLGGVSGAIMGGEGNRGKGFLTGAALGAGVGAGTMRALRGLSREGSLLSTERKLKQEALEVLDPLWHNPAVNRASWDPESALAQEAMNLASKNLDAYKKTMLTRARNIGVAGLVAAPLVGGVPGAMMEPEAWYE